MKKFVFFIILLSLMLYPALAFAATDLDNLPSREKIAVQELMDRAVLSGFQDGTFRPSQAVQRQQFAKYIVNALKLNLSRPSTPTFKDIAPNSSLYEYVETAASAGLINGTAKGIFTPTRSLKIGEAAAIVVRALEGNNGNYSSQIARAREIGIIDGQDNVSLLATRSKAALIIYNCILLQEAEAGSSSEALIKQVLKGGPYTLTDNYYTSEKGKFKIKLPSGWTAQSLDTGKILTIDFFDNESDFSKMDVEVGQALTTDTLDSLALTVLQPELDELQLQTTSFETISSEKIRLAGQDAVFYQFKGVIKTAELFNIPIPFHLYVMLTINKGNYYLSSVEDVDYYWDQNSPVYKEILLSFEPL
ncbi:MAG: S-layer homology domain-containing protein [Bacillota bacterium]